MIPHIKFTLSTLLVFVIEIKCFCEVGYELLTKIVICFKLHGINTLNAELNFICHLLALLGAHHILKVSRTRVKECIVRNVRAYFVRRHCEVLLLT